MNRIATNLFFVATTLISCRSAAGPDVRVHSGADFTAYESDAAIVWFSPWFQVDFTMDHDEAQVAYASYMVDLSPVFEKGLLKGESFYDAAGYADLAKPPRLVVSVSASDQMEFPDTFAKSPEPLVKILHVQRLESPDPMRKIYDLWATFHRGESGWGEFDHFKLVLVNPQANASTPPEAFANGASVDSFTYEGTEH